MSNPVSSSPSAQLPVFTSQLVDPQTGNATTLFHRFLAGLYLRTGGGAGVSTTDVSQVANSALQTATDANQSATLAQSTADSAAAVAANASTASETAQEGVNSCVTAIQALRVTSLQTQNNLNDVASKSAARANLDLSIYPMTVTFDTLTSGLRRFIPIVFGMQIPANFLGTLVYSGKLATADAVFTIEVVRNGVLIVIGSITLINNSVAYILSPSNAFNLVIGDVLVIQCPSPADATLAQVGITIPMTIS